MKWTIEILGEITPTQNIWERLHWSKLHKLKKQWGEWIRIHALIQKINIPKAREDQRRRVTVMRYSPGNPDEDNPISPAGKLILDPMRRWIWRKVFGEMRKLEGSLGWIWDDDPDHVDYKFIPEKSSRKEKRMVIIVEDI